MGSWGVKATESDYGLDLLYDNVIKHLEKSNFQFNVKEIKESLTKRIIDEIRYANRGCPETMMDYYIEITFPYQYDVAVLLLAECLADYFLRGELVFDIYERNTAPYQKKVSDFLYTSDDLREILNDLKALLNPTCDTFELWKDSKIFLKWQKHIKSLCKILSKQL